MNVVSLLYLSPPVARGAGIQSSQFEENEHVTSSIFPERNPVVVVDANGTAHVFFERQTPTGYQVMYANRSSEQWATWSTAFNVSSMSGDNVHPTVVIGEDAPFAHVIHLVFENTNDHKLYYVNRSLTGSGWFSSPVCIRNITGVEAKPFLAKYPGTPTNLSLVFLDGIGGVNVHHTSRLGWNWTVPVNVSKSALTSDTPAQAVNSTGGVQVVWAEDDTNDWELMYANSTSQGFSTPVNVTSNEDDDKYPKVAVNATDDSLCVAWEATRNFVQKYVTYGNSSDGYNFQFANVSSGVQPDLVADSKGGVHLVYRALEGVSDYEIFHTENESSGWFTSPVAVSQNTASDEWPRAGLDPDYDLVNVVWVQKGTPDRVDFSRQYTAPPNVTNLSATGTNLNNVWENVTLKATVEFFADIPPDREWAAWVEINTTTPTDLNLTPVSGEPGNYSAAWFAYYEPNGDYNATFHAFDGFKTNYTEWIVFTKFTTDTEAPLVTVHAPANNSHAHYSPIEFSATFEDHSSIKLYPNVTVNATYVDQGPLPENFTMDLQFNAVTQHWEASWTNLTLYPNGRYEAWFAVSDTLGHVNDTVHVNFTKDSDFATPHFVQIIEPEMYQNVTWAPFRFNITARDNRTVTSVKIHANASTPFWITCSSSDGENWTATWDDAQSYPEAWYNFTVYAYDAFGNCNSSQWVVAFRGFVQTDFTAPVIVGFHPKSGSQVPCCPVEFNVTISDESEVKSAWIEVNTSTPVELQLEHVQGTLYEVNWSTCKDYRPGEYQATVHAVDAFDNEATETTTFTLLSVNCTSGSGAGGDGGGGTQDDSSDNGTSGGEWILPPRNAIPGYPVGGTLLSLTAGVLVLVLIGKKKFRPGTTAKEHTR
ncbi:MAG: hypothetical protein ACTSU5_07835 [Promethearchaeota archaeon]